VFEAADHLSMGLLKTVLLIWLVGLPVGFWLLAAVYPWHLRRRYLRRTNAPAVALVPPLPHKHAAN
jgi:hypothetical protein